jgi:hypothetical protein
MDGVAHDAEIDARPVVGVEKILDRERGSAAPTPLPRHLRGIHMGMPIDDHGLLLLLAASSAITAR